MKSSEDKSVVLSVTYLFRLKLVGRMRDIAQSRLSDDAGQLVKSYRANERQPNELSRTETLLRLFLISIYLLANLACPLNLDWAKDTYKI